MTWTSVGSGRPVPTRSDPITRPDPVSDTTSGTARRGTFRSPHWTIASRTGPPGSGELDHVFTTAPLRSLSVDGGTVGAELTSTAEASAEGSFKGRRP